MFPSHDRDGGESWIRRDFPTSTDDSQNIHILAPGVFGIGTTSSLFISGDFGMNYWDTPSAVRRDMANVGSKIITGGTVGVEELVFSGIDGPDICIDDDCCPHPVYLTWLNHLGGWEYWNFCAQSDFGIEIQEVTTAKKNIFSNWPQSFIDAETEEEYVSIQAKKSITIRAENLSNEEADFISSIKTSIHVQWMIDGFTDKRTVLVDKDSFVYKTETEKLQSITFNILMSDDEPIQTIYRIVTGKPSIIH